MPQFPEITDPASAINVIDTWMAKIIAYAAEDTHYVISSVQQLGELAEQMEQSQKSISEHIVGDIFDNTYQILHIATVVSYCFNLGILIETHEEKTRYPEIDNNEVHRPTKIYVDTLPLI